MALFRGNGDSHSQVFWFPEDNGFNARLWKWDPGSSVPPSSTLNVTTRFNIFCAGHSVLSDGRLAVIGGTQIGDNGIKEVNIFNHRSVQWENGGGPVNNMSYDRYYPTSTTLADGRVFISSGSRFRSGFVLGGVNGAGIVVDTVSYMGLRLEAPWFVPDYVESGNHSAPKLKFFSSSDLGSYSTEDDCSITSNVFPDLIVYGGIDESGVIQDDLYELHWIGLNDTYYWFNTSGPMSSSPGPLAYHTATYDAHSKSIFVLGGLTPSGPTKGLYRLKLNPDQGCNISLSWETLSPSGGPAPLYGHTAIHDQLNRRIIIYGGQNTSSSFSDSTWILNISNPASPTWSLASSVGSPPPARSGHAAVIDTTCFACNETTQIYHRNMLIFGGFDGAGLRTDILWEGDLKVSPPSITWRQITAASYDPANRCGATQTGSAPTPRSHAAALVDPINSRVVIHGGDTNGPGASGGATSEVWEFFPGSSDCTGDKWFLRHSGSELPQYARYGHGILFETQPKFALYPEIFDHTQSVSQQMTLLTGPSNKQWLNCYPFMFQLPSGRLFYAGADNLTRIYDFSSGWSSQAKDSGFLGDCAVMYLPGKILKCAEKGNNFPTNGKRASSVDLSINESNVWSQLTDFLTERRDPNLTILPSGTVLLSGGVHNNYPGAGAVRVPQVWKEQQGWDAHLSAGQFLAAEPADRDYHSVAMLLPDATVISAGGEKSPEKNKATIYRPWYLFDSSGNLAPRPTIETLDTLLTYGCTFYIQTPDAGSTNSVSHVSMIRPGAVTHAFNQDQRYAPVTFTVASIGGKNLVTATAPATAEEAPPGDYLVFIVNSSGVPSIGRWVRLAPGGLWSGTPQGNTHWKSGEIHHVTGDLTFSADATVTIESGCEIVVSSDVTIDKNEGSGAMTITGTRFTGHIGGSAMWDGLKLRNGSSLTSCRIYDADIGITMEGSSTVSQSYIARGGTIGILARSGSRTIVQDTVMCPVDSVGFIGIYVDASLGSSTTLVSRCTITGANAPGSIGIYSKNNRTETYEGNLCRDFKNSTGTAGKGIWLDPIDSTSVNILTKATSPDRWNEVRNCSEGIYAGGVSRALIRYTRVDSCKYSIRVGGAANPDIGKLYDQGNCSISVTSNKDKLVYTDARLSGLPDVDAYYNYWGTANSATIAARMGLYVAWSPYLSNAPSGAPSSIVSPAVEPPNEFLDVSNFPNPLRAASTIRFRVPSAERRDVVVSVFDVSGRIVWIARMPAVEPGSHDIVWDGNDMRGQRARSGLYFVRVDAGAGLRETRRLTVLR